MGGLYVRRPHPRRQRSQFSLHPDRACDGLAGRKNQTTIPRRGTVRMARNLALHSASLTPVEAGVEGLPMARPVCGSWNTFSRPAEHLPAAPPDALAYFWLKGPRAASTPLHASPRLSARRGKKLSAQTTPMPCDGWTPSQRVPVVDHRPTPGLVFQGHRTWSDRKTREAADGERPGIRRRCLGRGSPIGDRADQPQLGRGARGGPRCPLRFASSKLIENTGRDGGQAAGHSVELRQSVSVDAAARSSSKVPTPGPTLGPTLDSWTNSQLSTPGPTPNSGTNSRLLDQLPTLDSWTNSHLSDQLAPPEPPPNSSGHARHPPPHAQGRYLT
ncbi:hypothetical protein B2J93_889 [Marssonina coronariae]|uniref:Uncharacterized protein n=1 Tax=Diplocarpon coronariae TaxID=2795749 RepID=A0A218ZCG4_9HELO|nr:hypothetical protein B2J93_889 [Marssonina coronariae]